MFCASDKQNRIGEDDIVKHNSDNMVRCVRGPSWNYDDIDDETFRLRIGLSSLGIVQLPPPLLRISVYVTTAAALREY